MLFVFIKDEFTITRMKSSCALNVLRNSIYKVICTTRQSPFGQLQPILHDASRYRMC